MSFNSKKFLLFFLLICGVYFALPRRHRWKLLLAGSYAFYMALRPEYIVFLLGLTLVDYVCGLRMGRRESRRERLPWLLVSLAGNVGFLVGFKYLGFLTRNLEGLLALAGLPLDLPILHLLLPLGISFHTLQSMGYSFDVYRGQRQPETHLGFFALYVAFFPQLVAGPIERSRHLLPQFHAAAGAGRKTDLDAERVISGLWVILGGFFKKLVIADRLAFYVDRVYGSPEQYGLLPTALATYLFAVQIYCDFSGYTDIAIGVGRVLGYDLMENFRRPYLAGSIREFWHRWHISLSTWFRDYVYIPLGGSRVSTLRGSINLLAVFLLSGLWHGAAWTFAVWGLLHALYYLAGQWTEPLRRRLRGSLGWVEDSRGSRMVQTFVTFHLVTFAWIFFRAESLPAAARLVANLGRIGDLPGVIGGFLVPGAVGWGGLAANLLLAGGWLAAEAAAGEEKVVLAWRRTPLLLRWSLAYLMIFAILGLGQVGYNEFIYFQF